MTMYTTNEYMQLIAGFSLFAYYIFLFFPILLKAAIFTKGR